MSRFVRGSRLLRGGGWAACLALAAAFASVGCASNRNKFEVPEIDEDAPSPLLTVIYEVDGTRQEKTVGPGDEPLVVYVPAKKSFSVVYSATDDGGVSALNLDRQFVRQVRGTSGAHTQQYAQGRPRTDDYSEEPGPKQLNVAAHPWPGEPREYEFQLTATDFHGNAAQTAPIYVRHGPWQ